ncbi:MAG: hypothetical protein M3O46_04830 [Myxococcota bacterium]|nr:hypothetical protein [Myxococcota bacterium]
MRPALYPLVLCALSGTALLVAGCNDPTAFDTKVHGPDASSPAIGSGSRAVVLNEDCPAGDDWIGPRGGPPPPVPMRQPPPHPDTECPFYRGAYQNFLIAMAPLQNGEPAIVRYATLDDAFHSRFSHAVRNTGDASADPYSNPGGAKAATTVRSGQATGRAWLGAVRQAGQRNILIDQDHHTVYYGLHMNQAFVEFIAANHLDTSAAILNVDPNLAFPPGLVEFKSAWKDIDPRDFPNKAGQLGMMDGVVPPPGDPTNPIMMGDPGDYSNYITTMAWIPWLRQNPITHAIDEDPDHPVQRKMALIAIHCVYTYPGHPEFVWGSIQHVNRKVVDPAPLAYAGVSILGAPDSQPDTTGPGMMPALPSLDDPQNVKVTEPPSMHSYLLFKGGTLEAKGNQAIKDSDLVFDEATQSFPMQATSVYRMFPGSKSNVLQPDSAVFSLNSNINEMFDKALNANWIDPAVDKRQHYRLVAAVWMDKPFFFGLGQKQADGTYPGLSLQNDSTNPLVMGAQQNPPNIYPDLNQGVFCGTPLDSTMTSGDMPNADGTNNTVPGCHTRADDLLLPHAPSPNPEADGGPINPLDDYTNQVIGSDSEFSIIGGEDRLSSTAMETFTQNGQFHNCFACHNTQPITTNGTPVPVGCETGGPGCPAILIPKAAKLNVSHLFSEFVLREQEESIRHDAGAN